MPNRRSLRSIGSLVFAVALRAANAVAQVARASGARIVDVRGYGEDYPVATNRTAEGMAKNRRVEILCVR